VVHIERSRAANIAIVDTALVALEVLGHLKRNSHRANVGDGVEQIRLRALSDVHLTGDTRGDLGGGELALAIAAGVRIVGLRLNATSELDVLEGLRRQTAVATEVSECAGAVDKLLLGEADEPALVKGPVRLQRTGRRERPARPTAWSLTGVTTPLVRQSMAGAAWC